MLQAMVGLRADDETPRKKPGLEPERLNFIRNKIEELRSRVDEGGEREAVVRSLVYIGMAGPGVDERAFNELRRIRAGQGTMTLEAFKMLLREQFFALMLDRERALAAIPGMLPGDVKARRALIKLIKTVVTSAGEPDGERARRLEEVSALFGA